MCVMNLLPPPPPPPPPPPARPRNRHRRARARARRDVITKITSRLPSRLASLPPPPPRLPLRRPAPRCPRPISSYMSAWVVWHNTDVSSRNNARNSLAALPFRRGKFHFLPSLRGAFFSADAYPARTPTRDK